MSWSLLSGLHSLRARHVASVAVLIACAPGAYAADAPAAAPAAAVSATPAAAPAPRKLPAGVVDDSFRLPDGERVLQLSAVVDGPPALAWKAFTTVEGFTAWAVGVARVDLRVGGEIESSYDKSVPLGSDRTIRNRILAFVPERALAIRNVQAPPDAPFDAAAFAETQTVVLFEPVDATHTRVTVMNGGYRDGDRFDGVYRHFHMGNAYTLALLRKHLAKLVAPAAATSSSSGAP